MDFAPQILLVATEWRLGIFCVSCAVLAEHCVEGHAALQSSFFSIFLFMLKMVSSICCCWPAMASTASGQRERKVGGETKCGYMRVQLVQQRVARLGVFSG